MILKSIILFGIAIFFISCRDASTALDTEANTEQTEKFEEKDASEIWVTDLPELLKTGMMIEEVKGLLSRADIKQHVLNKDGLMRIYFFHEQEELGDLVAIDLQLRGDLVADCKFGYRK